MKNDVVVRVWTRTVTTDANGAETSVMTEQWFGPFANWQDAAAFERTPEAFGKNTERVFLTAPARKAKR